MDAEKVAVRSAKKDTETILAVFLPQVDRPDALIEDAELLKAVGLSQKDKMFLDSVNRARSLFVQRTNVRLERVREVGYRVPAGNRQLCSAVCGTDGTLRRLGSNIRRIEEVPEHRLTEAGREKRMAALGKVRLIEEFVRSKTLPLIAESRSFESLPRMLPTT